jgi:2Fe-2S ferredoxin
MAGKNPYLKAPATKVATRPFKLTVKYGNEEQIIDVKPEDLPTGEPGLPGSILSILMKHHVPIDSACGGVCACSTCHIYLKKGDRSVNEANDDEEDMLDSAPAVTSQSRLACQTVPDGSMDIVVEIPAWNRNEVKEDH